VRSTFLPAPQILLVGRSLCRPAPHRGIIRRDTCNWEAPKAKFVLFDGPHQARRGAEEVPSVDVMAGGQADCSWFHGFLMRATAGGR
jgi:hypothetical protein